MTKSVDYYFALISPWTYMGLSRLVEVVGKTGATLNYKPVDILSATCPRERFLPKRLRPDFSVICEGYAGGAVNRPGFQQR